MSKAKIKADGAILATGRRKTSVAQVRLMRNGQGKILINSKTVDEYFRGINRYQTMVSSPLAIADAGKTVDLYVKVAGGGIGGQAGAIRHGIARALIEMDAALRGVIKKAGYLTRDPRMVERKKPGQPKARKRFQF